MEVDVDKVVKKTGAAGLEIVRSWHEKKGLARTLHVNSRPKAAAHFKFQSNKSSPT